METGAFFDCLMIKLIHIVIHSWLLLLFCFESSAYSQAGLEVRGFVVDATSMRPIGYATVSGGREGGIIAYADSVGLFRAELEGVPVVLTIASPGYDTHELELLELPDTVLRIVLEPRLITMGEIVVSATRIPQSVALSPSSISVATREEIGQNNGTSLASVISPMVGVFVKDYGGASGLKTIAQRGLGAEHTLILFNGLRVSSFQNGLVDLGMIPISEVEKVEVVRGGHSGTYGADALAGVVNVVMRPSSYTHTFEAATSVGSFGYKRYQLSGGTFFADLGIRASYQEERSAENFPFRFHNGNLAQDIRRLNADLFTRYGSIQSSVRISDDVELVSFAHSFKSERGVGGLVVSASSSSRARQTDKDNLAQMTLTAEILPSIRLRTSIQGHYAYQRYRDPDLVIGFMSLDNYFKNVDLRFESSLDYILNEKSRIIVGGELVRTFARGNSIVSNVRRSQVGSFLAGEHRVIRSAWVVSELVLYPALRFDAIASSVSSWSPRLGLLLAFKQFDTAIASKLKPALRASISRSFRIPTFNELYFNGGGGIGNPNLGPERSTGLEVGGTLSFSMAGDHYLQTSYFLTEMSDRIVWVPAGGLGVTPKNIRNVRSYGIETLYIWKLLKEFLTLNVNYTSLRSVKTSKEYPGDPNVNIQLPYIPQETLNLSLSVSHSFDGSVVEKVGATVSHQFVGFRFYSEDNVSVIPSYNITNLALRGGLKIGQFGVITKVEINNVFDEDYQVMIGYPMPLRSYRLTVGVEY